MRFLPARMLLLERSENNLFEIDRALREAWLGAEIRPLLADICDRETIGHIFAEQQPQVVFHCRRPQARADDGAQPRRGHSQ